METQIFYHTKIKSSKNPLKETKILQDIRILDLISSFNTSKNIIFQKSSHKNRPITQGPKSFNLLYFIMTLNTISLPWQARPTKFACCWLVSRSMQGFILSGPFVWALALVKPNTSGFTEGAPSFPLHILHHAGSFIAPNQIPRGKRCVASCELLGLRGQEHGKIRLGTMLDELSVLFHTSLFLQRQS